MNIMVKANSIIALLVVGFSMFALHQGKGKATRETEFKSALCYLAIVLIMAAVLFAAI